MFAIKNLLWQKQKLCTPAIKINKEGWFSRHCGTVACFVLQFMLVSMYAARKQKQNDWMEIKKKNEQNFKFNVNNLIDCNKSNNKVKMSMRIGGAKESKKTKFDD